MEIPMHEELRKGYDLLNNGKVEEALELINNFENQEHLESEDKHWYEMLKITLLLFIGKLPESLKIAEQGYQESMSHKNPLFTIDYFILKWGNFFLFGRAPELCNDVLSCEKLLKTVEREPPSEVKLREAFILYMKGFHLWWEGKFDEALENEKKCIELYENYDTFAYMLFFVFFVTGMIYTAKGEIDLALESHKKSLALSRGGYMFTNMINASSYQNIGEIYFQKGELDYAIEYYEKGLKIWEQFTYPMAFTFVGITYNSLIKAFLYKESPKRAQEYLDHFLDYLKMRKISEDFYYYKFGKVRILTSSSRTRDRAEAEKILKEFITAHDDLVKSGASSIPEENVAPLLLICNLYLKELRLTNDLEVLDDIQPFIQRLLKESERTKSFILQAQTYLLYGKICLLQMNMGDARRYLTQAQRIAEAHNLQLWARAISREHDKLLEQLDKWERLKSKENSISERMELASVDLTMDRMQGMRAIDPPELIDEMPILLLIIGQDGVSYFNHSFIENWDFDDLFSSFMSAFNTFSAEIFSESIDRIKIGDNLILIKPIDPFLVCYVIKGQSYPALMKLTRFSDAIKWKPEIWEALNKALKTSEILELNNPSSLGDVVNEIFNT